jgi:CheY-like chemotaxis protein
MYAQSTWLGTSENSHNANLDQLPGPDYAPTVLRWTAFQEGTMADKSADTGVAAGVASLAICESLLLALADLKLMSVKSITDVLHDASAAHSNDDPTILDTVVHADVVAIAHYFEHQSDQRNLMAHLRLEGCSILIVEGEARVVLEIVTALEGAGATATATTSIRHALTLVEHDDRLSAAILLSDGDRSELSAQLSARGVPYVTYSGPAKGESSVRLPKPVCMDELMKAMDGLLGARPTYSV